MNTNKKIRKVVPQKQTKQKQNHQSIGICKCHRYVERYNAVNPTYKSKQIKQASNEESACGKTLIGFSLPSNLS